MEGATNKPQCANCARLEAELAKVVARLDKLEAENARLREESKQLREKLEEKTRRSKRQATPFARGKQSKTRKKPGRKKGHQGDNRKPPDSVNRTIDVPAGPCPTCGSELTEVAVQPQYQTDLPPVDPMVTQFNVERGFCACCEKHVQGRHPEQTSDALGAANHQLGPRLLSLALKLKYHFGLPFRRVQELIQDLAGIHVSASAICRAGQRLACQALPAYFGLIDDLRSEGLVVHGDETGWRIDVNSSWLWVFSSTQTTVYTIDAGRDHEVVESILGPEFTAPLVCDGFSAYDPTPYLTPRCNGHPLHRISGLLENATGAAREHLMRIKAVFQDAVDLHHRRAEMSDTSYQRKVREIHRRFDQWLSFHGRKPSTEVRRLAKHLRKHKDEWFLHLQDEDIPPTNNHAERMIRPAVLGRKRGACNKTRRGADTYQVLTSIIVTLGQRGSDFLDWAAEVFHAGQSRPIPIPDG